MEKNCEQCGFAYNHKGPGGINCSLTPQTGDCLVFVDATKMEAMTMEEQEELYTTANTTIEKKYYSHCNKCEDCDSVLIPQVCMSAAGYYIGTMCSCGPYSRDSGYYKTREAAQIDLNNETY